MKYFCEHHFRFARLPWYGSGLFYAQMLKFDTVLKIIVKPVSRLRNAPTFVPVSAYQKISPKKYLLHLWG